jgi:hypothetical protein
MFQTMFKSVEKRMRMGVIKFYKRKRFVIFINLPGKGKLARAVAPYP